jgi:type I restriction enzyme S subunit
MTPDRFLEQFGYLADAPNGIAKLRELILQLAVRGKLVAQDPNDEPASVLLEKIRAEKERLVTQGKIKNTKPLPPIEPDEVPFDVPQSWAWERFSRFVIEIATGPFGSMVHKTDYVAGGVPLINPSHLIDGTVVADPNVSVSSSVAEKLASYALKEGDIVMARRGEMGRCAVVDQHSAGWLCGTGSFVLRFHEDVSRQYVILLFLTPSVKKYLGGKSVGSTMTNLNHGILLRMPVPFPPAPEQRRIVAKVDQLMSLCDELEAKKNQRTETHNRLVRAAHHPLTQARDHAELQSAWRRIRGNFDQLHTTLDSVRTLRQTILQLAVQGKLVPQDPNDEPASVLLEKIRAEKERLVAEGKIKNTKPPPSIKPDEVPFGVPQGWAWVRFNALIDPSAPLSYGVLVPGPDTPTGVPFVRLGDLDIESPAAQPSKRISAEVEKQYERTRLAGGEILLGVVGSIGKLGLAPASWRGANIARAVCRIQVSGFVTKRYVIRLLQSEFMQSVFHGDTRTLAQPTLNVGLIRNALVPVPPAREQCQIVQKIDQLLALCDELEAKIKAKESTAQHFAEAVVAELAA